MKKTDKFRTFWTMSAKNSHYAEGDSKNKENTNEFLGFIVLQRSWLPFVALEINKSFLIPIIVRPSCFLINPFFNHAFSVKMAGDWPLSFFWRFHGSRLRLALLTSCLLVNIAYMIILRCLSNIIKENERTTNKAKSIFVLEIFKYFSF